MSRRLDFFVVELLLRILVVDVEACVCACACAMSIPGKCGTVASVSKMARRTVSERQIMLHFFLYLALPLAFALLLLLLLWLQSSVNNSNTLQMALTVEEVC
jgi:hypothetical protein